MFSLKRKTTKYEELNQSSSNFNSKNDRVKLDNNYIDKGFNR